MDQNRVDLKWYPVRWYQWFFYIYGWLFVRPRRWLFARIRDFVEPHWWFYRADPDGPLRFPNIHRYYAHKVFGFFRWLYWRGWRKFAIWDEGFLKQHTWLSWLLMRIGEATSGYAIFGGACFHCGSRAGDPVSLSEEEGEWFILNRTWTVNTMDGTDYRFSGITICPRCGYRSYYEDGSL